MDMGELLAFGVKNGCSDLHLSSGLPPMLRVDGDVRRVNLPPLDHKEVHDMVYDIMNDKNRKDHEALRNVDSVNEIRLRIKLEGKDSKESDKMTKLEHLSLAESEEESGMMVVGRLQNSQS